MLFILNGCTQQENKPQNIELSNDKDAPIEDIVLKKEYDEDGNIIRYDSTYSSFYSNIQNNKIVEDSIIKDFKSMFQKKYPISYNPSFNDFFYRDSFWNTLEFWYSYNDSTDSNALVGFFKLSANNYKTSEIFIFNPLKALRSLDLYLFFHIKQYLKS